jgi:ABC-type nitrate/sulfonate/bicarbonate transport system substrate-binding protein
MGLRRLLVEAGIDLERDEVTIAPTPGSLAERINFGLMAAQALEDGIIDGFWANGMGAEIAVQRGIGTLVLDVRRGDGPAAAFNYTMATLAATERLIAEERDKAAAAVRAVVAAQKALVADVARAADVGRALFPGEAGPIVDLVRRDLPFYQAQLSPEFVSGMNRFARDIGILDADVPYERVVATEFSSLWR